MAEATNSSLLDLQTDSKRTHSELLQLTHDLFKNLRILTVRTVSTDKKIKQSLDKLENILENNNLDLKNISEIKQKCNIDLDLPTFGKIYKP